MPLTMRATQDLALLLCQAGAAIFLLLGVSHGVMTLLDLRRPQFFAPRDPRLIPALRQTSLGLSPKANFWRAWMGFNLSHSLGLVVFGGGLVYLSSAQGWESSRGTLTAASVVISVAYLILAVRFWFPVPAIAIGASTLLLIASWLLGRNG